MKLVRIAAVVLSLALVSGALAQSLRPLLPAETVAAVGVQGLSQQQAKIQPFLDEFDRIGVAKAFQDAFASTEQQAEQSANLPDVTRLPADLQGLSLLDVVGNEAYLAVSVKQGALIPAVTFVARVDAKAQAAVSKMIADEAGKAGVQKLTEGSLDFYVDSVDNGDGTTTPIAYAQDGALVAISNDTDVLRGVLRRHQGSNEPSFTSAPGYAATLGKLGDGQMMTYFDFAPLSAVVQPLLAAQGMDALATRVSGMLETLGATAGVSRLTATGVETHSLQKLGEADKDPALYALLSSHAPASEGPLAFVPATALSVATSNVALTSWWDYLGGLVASVPQLGVSNVDEFVQSMVGIDLRADLFDWMGQNVATITTPSPPPAAAGLPTSDLLGGSLFVLEAKDASAASSGLADLFGKLATQLASLTDPSGSGTPAAPETHQVGGVTVTTVTMAPGVTLAYAVTDGMAFIGTSPAALDAALQAKQAGTALPAVLAAQRGQVPSDAHSFTLTDAKTSMQNSAASLVAGIQTAAGMGGSQGLDIAKVTAATDALKQFLDFVAGKLGGAVSYSQVASGTLSSSGMTQVAW